MLSASAAPRWKRQTSTLPRRARSRSAANAVRRRKLGERPRVTSARAPDFTKTRRRMGGRGSGGEGAVSRSAALELGAAEREPDDLREGRWRAVASAVGP